ncbi:MAG: hypothetical protein E6Q89_00640 [Bacteroidia bacterium]|nr:MAG: hypothetical protein E6Q89_00640 [Bacteroidia bacterium]
MNDGPAVIHSNGSKEWWLKGKLHREDGPAAIYSSGSKYWCINGKLHREDGPAIIYKDGRKQWYVSGIQHTYEEWFNLLTPEQQINYFWNLEI